jgi:hypothetical protein
MAKTSKEYLQEAIDSLNQLPNKQFKSRVDKQLVKSAVKDIISSLKCCQEALEDEQEGK